MGVPTVRTIVFWGLYGGPPLLGSYHLVQVHAEARAELQTPGAMVNLRDWKRTWKLLYWGHIGITGTILGLYWDIGKEHGHCYLGFFG